MADFPVVPITMPAVLAGQKNGQLDFTILTSIGGGGVLVGPAARAWAAMVARAARDGIELYPTSVPDSYRNLKVQQSTFNNRYTTQVLPGRPSKICNGTRWYLKEGYATAACPGTSNHGWGLAVDVAYASGARLAWMQKNCLNFGFSWEFTSVPQPEPWHIRYHQGDNIPWAVLDYERTLTENPYVGIMDVSRWQDDVLTGYFPDWAKAAAHGVRGISAKVGKGLEADSTFRQHIESAQRAKLLWTGYWWPMPSLSPADPEEQARRFVYIVALMGTNDLPLQVDLEWADFPNWTSAQNRAWTKRFCQTVEEGNQRQCVIYSAKWWWDPHMTADGIADPWLQERCRWVANYIMNESPPIDADQWGAWALQRKPAGPNMPAGWHPWRVWQFSADTNIMGANYGAESRDIDLNLVLKEEWANWTANVPKPPEPTPLPPGEIDLSKLAVVKKGDSGFSVSSAQANLNVHRAGAGLPQMVEDGNFGNQTEQAVKDFQKSKGLTQDGIVGTATWTALLPVVG